MNSTPPTQSNTPVSSRLTIFRLLWWIPQSIIVSVWRSALVFVALWQIVYIICTGTRHGWSVMFARKFAHHLKLWIEYTFWVTDEKPDFIVF